MPETAAGRMWGLRGRATGVLRNSSSSRRLLAYLYRSAVLAPMQQQSVKVPKLVLLLFLVPSLASLLAALALVQMPQAAVVVMQVQLPAPPMQQPQQQLLLLHPQMPMPSAACWRPCRSGW